MIDIRRSVELMATSPDAPAAYDILIRAGWEPHKAADFAMACQRTGWNARAMARCVLDAAPHAPHDRSADPTP